MVRKCDSRSWAIAITILTAVIGVTIALILLFLPQIKGNSKSTAPGTTSPPKPYGADFGYYIDQLSNNVTLYKDSSGNVFTGTITAVYTRNPNWNVISHGDETSKGFCCDVLTGAGLALWFAYSGNVGLCNNFCQIQIHYTHPVGRGDQKKLVNHLFFISYVAFCVSIGNHKRLHSCLLNTNWIVWKFISSNNPFVNWLKVYDPSYNYIGNTQPPYVPVPTKTDLFIITPPLYTCDQLLNVVANATILA